MTALACLFGLLLVPAGAAQDVLPGGRAIFAAAAIAPDTHLFAEPVLARVDVILDPRQFDPDRTRVRLHFAPYERVGAVRERRREVGELVHLRYEATLRCLHVGCIAPRFRTVLGEQEEGRPERYAFRFRPAEILYEAESGRPQVLLRRTFPIVEVVSRINTAQLQSPEQPLATRGGYAATLVPTPPTYRMPPAGIAAIAVAAAFALLIFPATFVGRILHARWRASRRPRRLSRLERALMLVDWTSRPDVGQQERREALEALADALERSGAVPLAEMTRTFAWAKESPDRKQAAELLVQARRTITGGGVGRPA